MCYFQCAEGSHVKLRVGGDFYFDAEVTVNKPDLLLIAGGVGINPLFSMWRHARDLDIASNDYPDSFGKLMLLYSVSTHDELIFNVSMQYFKIFSGYKIGFSTHSAMNESRFSTITL